MTQRTKSIATTLTFTAAAAALTLSFTLIMMFSCAKLDKLTDKDGFVEDLRGKLKDAIQDIDPQGLAQVQLCKRYKKKGVVLAEASFANEWPHFEPLWRTASDPVADLQFCRGLIEAAGATIITKTSDSGAASALCFVAQIPKDFESKPDGIQAGILCHEAFHILEQKRVGCKDWAALYFGTVSARLTFEGTAYALMWALLERYGWSKEQAEAAIRKRADRFPERYSIPPELITPTCTWEYWSAIRGALRERTGR